MACGFTRLLHIQDRGPCPWARDTTAHLPVFLHLRTTNFPFPESITRSEQAQQSRLERKATKHERRQSRKKLTQPSAC